MLNRAHEEQVQSTPADSTSEPKEFPPVPLRRMTWPEIQAAYPDCWVVLGELEDDPVSLVIHSAVVLGWGKTRRECMDNSPPVSDEMTAQKHTGAPKSPWHRPERLHAAHNTAENP
jgi:hypothetical protein